MTAVEQIPACAGRQPSISTELAPAGLLVGELYVKARLRAPASRNEHHRLISADAHESATVAETIFALTNDDSAAAVLAHRGLHTDPKAFADNVLWQWPKNIGNDARTPCRIDATWDSGAATVSVSFDQHGNPLATKPCAGSPTDHATSANRVAEVSRDPTCRTRATYAVG